LISIHLHKIIKLIFIINLLNYWLLAKLFIFIYCHQNSILRKYYKFIITKSTINKFFNLEFFVELDIFSFYYVWIIFNFYQNRDSIFLKWPKFNISQSYSYHLWAFFIKANRIHFLLNFIFGYYFQIWLIHLP
jgi:hypothetical protein